MTEEKGGLKLYGKGLRMSQAEEIWTWVVLEWYWKCFKWGSDTIRAMLQEKESGKAWMKKMEGLEMS